MATIDIEVAGRRYSVACRDGEEQHLRSVAALVDRKAEDAAAALGSLSESRQLLFAALLLGDELKERQSGIARTEDPDTADALERVAARLESLAGRLEGRQRTS